MGKSQDFFWGNGERGTANAADRDPSPPAERRESVQAWTPSAPSLIGEPSLQRLGAPAAPHHRREQFAITHLT